MTKQHDPNQATSDAKALADLRTKLQQAQATGDQAAVKTLQAQIAAAEKKAQGQ